MAAALLWTGCENEGMNEPKQGDSFTLSVCLPAEEVHATRACAPRRMPGDPGSTEQFALPNYIYIIVMKQTGESTWELWRVITESDIADDGKWTKRRYVGPLQTMGDSIYQYKKEISELLSPGESNFNGRVYVVASAENLTFNKNLENITDLEDLENLTFNSGAVQSSIQHIYTTPYNYLRDGDYYGSFKNEKVPHLDLVLYHVAAKVDINWFVAENKRIDRETPANAVRLTSMKACNLFNGYAYCFKPMENKQATKVTPNVAGTGDTITMVTPSDMGLWWEGRSYFYTIPYTLSSGTYQSHYPLQMQMETNESGAIYKPTVYLEVNTTSPFVPWLRATFNINNPLEERTEDKTVSL